MVRTQRLVFWSLLSAFVMLALPFLLNSPVALSTAQPAPTSPPAVQPEAPAAESPEAGQAADSPTAEPDCHGPLYYKMKADGEKRLAHDSVKKQIIAFTFDVQEILVQQQEQEYKRLLDEKLESSKRCASVKMLPSFLCNAYKKRDLDACLALTDGFDSMVCRVVLGVDLGAQAAFPPAKGGALKEKFRTDDMGVSLLLTAAKNGHFECPEGLPNELAPLCQAAREAVAAGGARPDSPVEAKMLAHWALALYRRDIRYCDGLPKEDHAEFCRAFLAKDMSQCKARRSLVDVVDRDWSCRSTLLATRLHPTKQGSEVVLTIGSPYIGTATCMVRVVTEYGGTQNRRDVKALTLKTFDVHQVRIPLSGEKFLRAESDCQWTDADWSAR